MHKATKQTRQEQKVAREVQVPPPQARVVHLIGGTSISTYNQQGEQSTTNKTEQHKQPKHGLPRRDDKTTTTKKRNRQQQNKDTREHKADTTNNNKPTQAGARKHPKRFKYPYHSG